MTTSFSLTFPRALVISVVLHVVALGVLLMRPSPAVWGPIIPVTLISLPGLKVPSIQPAPAMPEKAKARGKDTIPAKPASRDHAVPRPVPAAAPAAHAAPVAVLSGPILPPGMQDSPFAFYFQILKERVDAACQRLFVEDEFPATRRTDVVFRLLADGTVDGVRLRRRSGDEVFDTSALRAIQSAAPFPPFPDGFPEAEVRMTWGFRGRP